MKAEGVVKGIFGAFAVYALLVIGIFVAVICVAAHFIHKLW